MDEAGQVAATAPSGQVVQRLVLLDEAVSPSAGPDVRDWLSQRFGQATGQGVYGDFRATTSFDVMDRVAEIRLPTLIITAKGGRNGSRLIISCHGRGHPSAPSSVDGKATVGPI